jgi:hypothetical protein
MLFLLLLILAAFSFSVHADWNPSYLKPLNTKYQILMNAVRAGVLPEERGEEAEKLWLSVRRNLKTIGAEIEVLKHKVMEHHGKKQEQVLDQIVTKGAESAERVEIIFRAIQKTDALLIRQQYEAQGVYLFS